MYRQFLAIIVMAAVIWMVAMSAVERWDREDADGRAAQLGDRGPGRPNVVLVVLDALRADRVDAVRNGEPVMPHLAQYARENVRFTRAISPCTWTRPAVASILTSLYVDTHQVVYGRDPRYPDTGPDDSLPKTCEGLATFLKKAGYATYAVQTNANCAAPMGFAEGFDRYDYAGFVPGDVVTQRALDQLKIAASPFFLYVHYMDPHIPYGPPEAYRKLFGFPPALSSEELKTVTNFMDYFWDHVDLFTGNKPQRGFAELSSEAKEAVRMLYDGDVRFLDDALDRFLTRLHERYPNTFVIVLADHGEHFWDHGALGHGLTEYGEELDVPLIVSGPGLRSAAIARRVGTIDVAPTVAALLHLEPNPRWQGSDLFLDRKEAPVFSLTRSLNPSFNTDFETVVLARLKLILNNRNGQLELYDLAADPLEMQDLAVERRADAEKLKTLLLQHREACIQARIEGITPSRPELDPALIDDLRSIGYVK